MVLGNSEGGNRHIYRIVCAYQPCGKTSTSFMGIGTIYYQQIRHQISRGETICPRMLLLEELVQVKEWKQKYKRIILTMDDNEDIKKLELIRGLT